ncbi:phosphatase PAP2 family protein [Natronomonas sp. F2-12]|jgi:membrane-associated phospholipid phosphatase|uniref:Phosphatase PAP2 family protein n=1 Tax=Natronomonas aquatica TaxID=2841590 RepID=A0A9R1CRE8_9EURY|nr:phosphatase PAP2 family protein [Natronomonas aquatica]MCQ4333754.1 phosphatase PAP2 family protein [Natronomonas aquatica]
MRLVFVVGQLVGSVVLLLAFTTVIVVGRDRIVETRREYRQRFAAAAPYVGLLGVVLVANKIARDIGPDLSWLVGIRITGWLERIDGLLLWPFFPDDTPQAVVWLQSMATPELTAYFSFVYVYGYVYLLVFPLVAYFALSRPEPLRRTIVAYGTNYLVGVLCYVVFVAYGPRNLLAEQAEGLLFSQYTQYQFVTDAVNHETNVFPSLHTSMAVTAALLAWTTREEYPLWVPVAVALAVSVVVSTMYLGIHWATDAIFGALLAWFSVRVGTRFEETPPTLDGARRRFSTLLSVISGRTR